MGSRAGCARPRSIPDGTAAPSGRIGPRDSAPHGTEVLPPDRRYLDPPWIAPSIRPRRDAVRLHGGPATRWQPNLEERSLHRSLLIGPVCRACRRPDCRPGPRHRRPRRRSDRGRPARRQRSPTREAPWREHRHAGGAEQTARSEPDLRRPASAHREAPARARRAVGPPLRAAPPGRASTVVAHGENLTRIAAALRRDGRGHRAGQLASATRAASTPASA